MKTLKIKTLNGYSDEDNLLLHAAFQVLVNFVESNGHSRIDWNHDEEHKTVHAEMMALYKWWTKERPKRKSPLSDKSVKRPPFILRPVPNSEHLEMVPYDRKKYAAFDRIARESVRLEKVWYDEDTANLIRLVKLRPFLWV